MLYDVNEACIEWAGALKMSNVSEVSFDDLVIPDDLQRKIDHVGKISKKEANYYKPKKPEKQELCQQGVKRLKGHTDEGELVIKSRKVKALDFSGSSTEDYKHKLEMLSHESTSDADV
jgi:hypothetical protein